MANVKLSKTQWQNLKLSNVAGVPDSKLSKKYKITESRIREERSKDEAWATAYALVKSNLAKLSKKRETSAIAAVAKNTTDSLAEMGNETSLHMAKLTSKTLKRVAFLPEMKTVQDVATVFKMNRTATGLDKTEGGIQINFGAFFAPQSGNAGEPKTIQL